MDASIIIVSYNTRDLLRDCLASLDGGCTGITHETIVVDNASADGSADLVAESFPRMRLVRGTDNPGFAAANNRGLELARGRYVVLLNPDTEVRPGALAELVNFMDAHPGAGYCGPRLLNADGSHQASARRFPTLLSAAWNTLGWDKQNPRSRHCADLHLAGGDTATMRAGWLTGACLLVRRAALEQVGPLDAGYFMYFEETDWCHRLARAGWEGWYVPTGEVVHYGGQSSAPAATDAPFFGNRPAYWIPSRRRYMRRHHGRLALVAGEVLEFGLNVLLWLRHRWRGTPESRLKVRRATQTLRWLIGRGASSKT
jgi:N-acetylglucosaminyl-diphospho-decaprenol L-rhamnosyltransferase